MKKALISGIIGQDGSYFAEFLLDKGYEVQTLLGNPSMAKEVLGWEPQITVQEICQEMIIKGHKK